MGARDEDVSAMYSFGIRSAIMSLSSYGDGVIYCMQMLACTEWPWYHLLVWPLYTVYPFYGRFLSLLIGGYYKVL